MCFGHMGNFSMLVGRDRVFDRQLHTPFGATFFCLLEGHHPCRDLPQLPLQCHCRSYSPVGVPVHPQDEWSCHVWLPLGWEAVLAGQTMLGWLSCHGGAGGLTLQFRLPWLGWGSALTSDCYSVVTADIQLKLQKIICFNLLFSILPLNKFFTL